MKRPDAPYKLLNDKVSMRQAARDAMGVVDFYFTEEITREDFMTDDQYNCFMDRAKELGIKVK